MRNHVQSKFPRILVQQMHFYDTAFLAVPSSQLCVNCEVAHDTGYGIETKDNQNHFGNVDWGGLDNKPVDFVLRRKSLLYPPFLAIFSRRRYSNWQRHRSSIL
jgi:hypothetical protein